MEAYPRAVPAALVQLSVNVALMDRVTLVIAPEVTGPTLRLMEHVGAGTGVLLYDQVQVTSVGLPTTTAAGFAENEASTGATGGTGGTTVTCASFTDSPF